MHATWRARVSLVAVLRRRGAVVLMARLLPCPLPSLAPRSRRRASVPRHATVCLFLPRSSSSVTSSSIVPSPLAVMGITLGFGVTAAASVAALAVAYPAFWLWEVGRLEKPRYTLLRELAKNKELRRYEPYIIAETEVRDDDTRGDDKMKAAMNQGACRSVVALCAGCGALTLDNSTHAPGFGRVGGFIFGGNTKRESVAMTSPVRTERSSSETVAMTSPVRTERAPGAGSYRVSFVMPSKYTLETLPIPREDLKVSFRTVEGHDAAAVTFYGGMDMGEMSKQSAELRKVLEREKLEPAGPEVLNEYYPVRHGPRAPTRCAS